MKEPLKFPEPGTKVTRRKVGKTETRTVLDRTLGGLVVYVSGRPRRNSWKAYGERCTLEEWHAWVGSRKS